MSKYMDALEKIEERKSPKRMQNHSELIEFVNARPAEKKRFLPVNFAALLFAGGLLVIAFYGAGVYQKNSSARVNYPLEGNADRRAETLEQHVSLKFFTIQLRAYRDLSRASKEIEILTAMGLGNAPFIYEEKGEFKVCLGQFDNNASAYRELLELRAVRGPKFYKDAFVRIIKK